MSTDPDRVPSLGSEPLASLKPTQLAALQALLAGATVTDAAKAAGVDRTRVSAWKNHHPEFMAAYNDAKRKQFEQGRRRLEHLADSAIDNIERAIVEEGDVRASFRLLERLAKRTPEAKPEETTDPDVIRLMQKIRAWQWDQILSLLDPASDDGTPDHTYEANATYEALEEELAAGPRPDPEAQRLQEVRRKMRQIGRDNPELVRGLKELVEESDDENGLRIFLQK